MAQKKVILQDGQNDLMPKTLASVVFTEDGTSVETALKNLGSGGGSSGGGTGNVKVTNASSLNKDNYYAFKPSANGSVEGTFSTIPGATESKAGLMSSYNYEKLGNIKSVIALPVEVADYDENTSSDTIEAMLSRLLGEGIAPMQFILIASALGGEYNADNYKFYIGEYECLLSGSVDSDPVSATLEFSYVSQGKLRTIAITLLINGVSPNYTYTYSAKVLESGDDTYYLPAAVYSLSAGATHEDIIAALGGSIDSVATAIKEKKHLFFVHSNLGIFNYSIPVTASQILDTGLFLSFMSFLNNNPDGEIREIICYRTNPSSSQVKTIYLSGYSLPASLFSLTSSSTSDEISTAVGGESGLKEIIQAVKDGNRLVFRGAFPQIEDAAVDLTVKSVAYIESENGDISLGISFDVYLFMGYTSNFIMVEYTKSSNTFTADSYSKSFA